MGEAPYETTRFDAVGYAFAVRTNHAAVDAWFDQVFQHLRAPGGQVHSYELTSDADASGTTYRVCCDGELLVETPWPSMAFRRVVWHVNQQAIAQSPHLLLHAGGVAHGEHVVALPAATGSGKSTLTAALVRSGLAYLTDELVALDRDTDAVIPYPRWISLDSGSWAVLPDLEPAVPAAVQPFVADQWQLDPAGIPGGTVGTGGVLSTVVFPQYVPGGGTELRAIPRSEALVELTNSAFQFRAHPRPTLASLARVIANCRCYRLRLDDLTAACAAVLDVVP